MEEFISESIKVLKNFNDLYNASDKESFKQSNAPWPIFTRIAKDCAILKNLLYSIGNYLKKINSLQKEEIFSDNTTNITKKDKIANIKEIPKSTAKARTNKSVPRNTGKAPENPKTKNKTK